MPHRARRGRRRRPEPPSAARAGAQRLLGVRQRRLVGAGRFNAAPAQRAHRVRSAGDPPAAIKLAETRLGAGDVTSQPRDLRREQSARRHHGITLGLQAGDRLRGFAAENSELWRAMFEHRMAHDKELPDWSVSDQMALFRHVHRPLSTLLPGRSAEELAITARSLFCAVHGMVALGLERRLVAVPLPLLRKEIAALVRATLDGLVAREQ